MPSTRRYLIVHGWQNHRPAGHWQRWLAERLRARGEHVAYPQLPDPDHPRLADWLGVLRAELAALGDGERIVVTHSLGCLLWLQHARDAAPEHGVDRLLMVCPPSRSQLPAWLGAFCAEPPAGALGRTVGGRPELVCTDHDPWCPEGAREVYAGGGDLVVHEVVGGGHLSLDEGYGPWPAVERWAETGRFPAAAPSAGPPGAAVPSAPGAHRLSPGPGRRPGRASTGGDAVAQRA